MSLSNSQKKNTEWLAGVPMMDSATVEQFCGTYYRSDRYHARGSAYVESVLRSAREDIQRLGYTCISHYDSTTGQTIQWRPYTFNEISQDTYAELLERGADFERVSDEEAVRLFSWFDKTREFAFRVVGGGNVLWVVR